MHKHDWVPNLCALATFLFLVVPIADYAERHFPGTPGFAVLIVPWVAAFIVQITLWNYRNRDR